MMNRGITRKCAVFALSLGLVASTASTALAKTKEEKALQDAQASEMAPQMLTLLSSTDLPETAEADQAIDIQYVVFFGGFHLATLDFKGRLKDGIYEIRSQITTEGVADALLRTTAQVGSKGMLSSDRIQPVLYNSDITDKNQRQLVAVGYEEDLPINIESFPQYNLERFPVSEDLKRESIDPVTAIMHLLLNGGTSADAPCGGTVPVFDGRRRYDMLFEFVEMDEVSTGRNGAYEGEALRCWVGYKKVAGFKPPKRKKRNSDDERSDWPEIDMWIAEMGDGQFSVPVRFQSLTSFGAVVARAVKVEIHTRTELAGDMSAPMQPIITPQ